MKALALFVALLVPSAAANEEMTQIPKSLLLAMAARNAEITAIAERALEDVERLQRELMKQKASNNCV